MSITLCQIMEQLRPKIRNPLETFVLSIIVYYFFLMLLTNFIMLQEDINYLHNTKVVLVVVHWENMVSAHRAATA